METGYESKLCIWASCQIRKIADCACTWNAGNVFPQPWVTDPVMHHGTCVTHVPSCMPGSLTSGFLWSRCRWKHARRMRNFTYLVRGPCMIFVTIVRTTYSQRVPIRGGEWTQTGPEQLTSTPDQLSAVHRQGTNNCNVCPWAQCGPTRILSILSETLH